MSPPAIDPELLRALLRHREPVAIDDAQVNKLRAAGCDIAESAAGCFTLVRTSLSVWSDYLAQQNRAQFPRRIVEIYRQTSSTQNVIRRLIESRGHAANGAVAATDEQTAGRGRLGRKWHAPPGWSVLFSTAWFAPLDSARGSEWLAMSAAVAVANGLKNVLRRRGSDASTAARVGIKWPNDVMINSRKVAGILVEALPQYRAAIIGIGINVHHDAALIPNEVRHRFGSLDMFGFHGDRLLVLSEVLTELDRCLAADAHHENTLDAWRKMNIYGPQQIVTFQQNGELLRGCILDLDAAQGLIVRTTEGAIVHLTAATTSVVVDA